MVSPISRPSRLRRRLLLLGSLLVLYPLVRFITHRLPRKPRLFEVSGSLAPGGFLVRDDFYVFADEQSLWAVTRTCTHLGCRLSYKEKEGYLECPCHQSRFTKTGEVLRGPAKNNLASYQVEPAGAENSYIVTVQ